MFRYRKMYEQRSAMKKQPWLGKMTPFKIIGNTYFVGTYQASCHVIDTGDGLIMIDPGYTQTAYLVIDSLYQLGFNPRDVKYIINTRVCINYSTNIYFFSILNFSCCNSFII